MTKQHAALLVLLRTPGIREFLEENDPQALKQGEAALEETPEVHNEELDLTIKIRDDDTIMIYEPDEDGSPGFGHRLRVSIERTKGGDIRLLFNGGGDLISGGDACNTMRLVNLRNDRENPLYR